MVEKDDSDNECIIIVFHGETKRTKTKMKIEDFNDKKNRSTMFGAQIENSSEESTKSSKKYIELEAVQFIKKRDEKLHENGRWKETRKS